MANGLNKPQKERSKKKADRDLSDIRKVALLPEGRRLIWRMLSRSGVFQMNGYDNLIDMARFTGRRNTGVELLTDVMLAKASLFAQMQQEHASEAKREKIEIETETENSDLLSID